MFYRKYGAFEGFHHALGRQGSVLSQGRGSMELRPGQLAWDSIPCTTWLLSDFEAGEEARADGRQGEELGRLGQGQDRYRREPG